MKNRFLAGMLFLLIALPASALSPSDIVGTWKGDKALGDVVFLENGEGYLVFESNQNLTMHVTSTLKGSQFVIAQTEKNRKEFYLAFNPFFAEELKLSDANAVALANEARPFRWLFSLSADGKTLTGTKETTKFDKDSFGVFSIDNNFSRPATWTRLKGRLDPPQFQTAGELEKTVVITHSEPDVKLFYTTDGTPPIAGQSTVFTTPVAFKKSGQLQVVASKPGFMTSNIARTDVAIEAPKPVPVAPVPTPAEVVAKVPAAASAPAPAAKPNLKLGFYEDFTSYSEGDVPSGWFGIDRFMVKKVDTRKFLVPMDNISYSGGKMTTPRINYFPNYRVEVEVNAQAWMNGTTITIECEQFTFGLYYCDRFPGRDLVNANSTFINGTKGTGVSFAHTGVINLTAEKQGNIVSLFFNGQKLHFTRIVPTEKTGGITISVGGSNAFNSFLLKKVAVTEL